VKECGLDYTQTSKGNAYLSLKAKQRTLMPLLYSRLDKGNGGYFIPQYNTFRYTGLERGGSGTRTGTEGGAQFKISEIKENRARIK
jgi:hypothetical protein